VKKRPTLKRISSGLNYFTGQMKFKTVTIEDDIGAKKDGTS
jgi:hypothetical protein